MSGSNPEEAWLSEEPWAPFPNTMHTNCQSTHSTGDFLSQSTPLETTGNFYPDERPTESIEGFLNDGWKHHSFIVESCKQTRRDFQWFVTINYEVVLSIEQIRQEWSDFSKKTSRLNKKGLALFWVREITPSDPRRLHYHLGILEGFSDDKNEVRRVMDQCVSHFSQKHVRVEYRDNPYAIAKYMLKLEQNHRDKILLFKPDLDLRRVGHLGHFRPKGKKKAQILKQVKARKKRIKEGMSIGGNAELARHISTFVGRPYREIRITVGEDPYSPVWEQWQDNLWAQQRLSAELPPRPQATTVVPDHEDPVFVEDLLGTPSPGLLKGPKAAPYKPVPKKTGRRRLSRTKGVRRQAKASDLVRSVFGAKTTRRTRTNRPSRSRTRHSIPRPLFNNSRNPEISIFRSGLLSPSPSDIRLPRGHSP